jgi:hypothetical protein
MRLLARNMTAPFFVLPSGEVEFYVFSPMWNGNPQESAVKPNEVVVSQRQTRTKSPHGDIVVQWKTWRARNGSYWRAIVDRENVGLNTRVVFGIRYRNAAVLRRYTPAYARSKTRCSNSSIKKDTHDSRRISSTRT